MGLWIVLPLLSSTFYTTHLVLSHLSNPLLYLYLCHLGETCWNIKKLWNFYSLLVNVHVWTVAPVLGPGLTDALDLTAVKCNVIVLCNLHTREMLLSLPAVACCSSVLLLCHCSAAQVQLVGLCNHWVRLHSCTLPVLLLKLLLSLGLGWRVQTFFVSLSWVSITWVLWLGHLEQVFPWNLSKLSKFTSCSYISPLVEEIVEKSSRNVGVL